MLKARERLSALRTIALAGLASLSISCGGEPGIQEPPLTFPFDAGRVGSETEFEVRIVEKSEYLLSIVFLTKSTPEESIRIEGILGVGQRVDGQWIEPGVPAAFLVDISKQPSGQEMLSKLVDHPKTRAGHVGRRASIAAIYLEPGHYRVKLEYVRGAPELAALPARLSFSKAHHGK